MFPKIGVFPPNHLLKNRVFHYFHHPFWGKIPYFWKYPNGYEFWGYEPPPRIPVETNGLGRYSVLKHIIIRIVTVGVGGGIIHITYNFTFLL